ncbi:MAG TPA: SDR family NAD(P)-dependent oxidoreductase [Spirochaetota bacterium]|nr:SDR family NAD(P)-dependent oxidoreductase [Spirochaetota bacterium]
MYKDLKGKTALITGAGKRTGMGYAIARKMASCGAHIIIADLGTQDKDSAVKTAPADEMKDICEELTKEYSVKTLAVPVDVCGTESVNAMIDSIKKEFAHVDILCNNAGAAFGVPNTLNNYDETQWLKTIDVNLNGTYRVTKAVLPLMTGRPGAIVNTASRAGKFPPLFNGAYACAKAGVIMFTKVMAKEMGGLGIRVNAICPGQVYTDLLKWQLELESQFYGNTFEERKEEMAREIPLGFIGEIEDAAKLVAFLASDESRYITGQAVNLCGGQLMEL